MSVQGNPIETDRIEIDSNNVEGKEYITEDEEESIYDVDKIKLLPGSSEDGTAASFQILEEDHTLGNALRYMIMKNPEVEFCGYSIPHPSEKKLNIRIQTYGNITAVEAFHQGLDNLSELCGVVEEKLTDAFSKVGEVQ
ncbi:RPC19 [Candida pseudojiufengensis]|uniref:RPC19 n=1 Tax=Candida pseudojiufengensis TaxID=497109 RepID=UPI002225892A|nr:RPC19 [Candida pseudojiufengensis]KAI5966833.1 RPC19 [Candida pseudojiufengensis]